MTRETFVKSASGATLGESKSPSDSFDPEQFQVRAMPPGFLGELLNLELPSMPKDRIEETLPPTALPLLLPEEGSLPLLPPAKSVTLPPPQEKGSVSLVRYRVVLSIAALLLVFSAGVCGYLAFGSTESAPVVTALQVEPQEAQAKAVLPEPEPAKKAASVPPKAMLTPTNVANETRSTPKVVPPANERKVPKNKPGSSRRVEARFDEPE